MPISGLTALVLPRAGGKAAVVRFWDHENFRYFLEVPPAPCAAPALLAPALPLAQQALRLAALSHASRSCLLLDAPM